jgi:hypothetical protein
MMTNIWPYILRLALAIYFIFEHLSTLLKGYKGLANGTNIFECISGYIPPIAAFTIWHGGFVLLAALIVLWPRPVTILSISLFVLLATTYIKFTDVKHISSTSNLLTLICILLNLALLIIYAKRRY